MFFRIVLALMLASTLLAPAVSVHADDQVAKVVDKASPSIVTVGIVLKVSMKSNGQSQSSEARTVSEGTIVSPDGLIMMSSAPISNDLLKQLSGSDDDRSDFSVSPTDFKVTIGTEQKVYSAYVAATDPKTGLAFLKISDLGDRKLPAVDFSTGTAPTIGDDVLAVSRLSKGYDYAPVYSETRVDGHISKPRSAWLLGGDIISIGLPVYSMAGDAVGVMSFLPTGITPTDRDSGSGMDMMHFFDGSASDRGGVLMLPATDVNLVIEEAKKQAVTIAAQRAANPPAPTPAPAAPAMPKTAAPAAK